MADLHRLIPHQIKESIMQHKWIDRAMAKEICLVFLVACAVWLSMAAIFYLARFGLVGGE
jgi:hypothetical protein